MPLDGTVLLGDPPPPPARPDGDRRPRRELPCFMPCLHLLIYDTGDKYHSREIWRGMYTVRYHVMSLWDYCYVTVTEKDDPELVAKLKANNLPMIRDAYVSSEKYWEWVRLYHPIGEIFPHIQWGGHIKSTPGGDGGAGYRAWKLHALTLR